MDMWEVLFSVLPVLPLEHLLNLVLSAGSFLATTCKFGLAVGKSWNLTFSRSRAVVVLGAGALGRNEVIRKRASTWR